MSHLQLKIFYCGVLKHCEIRQWGLSHSKEAMKLVQSIILSVNCLSWNSRKAYVVNHEVTDYSLEWSTKIGGSMLLCFCYHEQSQTNEDIWLIWHYFCMTHPYLGRNWISETFEFCQILGWTAMKKLHLFHQGYNMLKGLVVHKTTAVLPTTYSDGKFSIGFWDSGCGW